MYVSYGVTEDIRLYANTAKGFRSGGFNFAGLPTYDPESVWSHEVGIKSSLFEGRVSAELAVFYSDYDDYQIVGVVPGQIFNVTSNAGKAEMLGIDWTLAWAVSEQMQLGFNGNYIDTEFIEINATSSSHAVGDPVDFVPQYGYTLWADYSFDWFDGQPGFMRLDFNRQGKAYYRNRSLSDDYRSTSGVIDMLNARVGWENNHWSVELFATNLLNDRGFTSPFAIENIAARARPRTLGLNIGLRF